jgi:hypothetical protein
MTSLFNLVDYFFPRSVEGIVASFSKAAARLETLEATNDAKYREALDQAGAARLEADRAARVRANLAALVE